MISPHGTKHPHGTQDIPHSTHDIPHGTEHPHGTAHTLYRVNMAISQLLLSEASSNLVGRKSKCYFIIKFSLLLSIRLCWREIRPDVGETTDEFVASFL